MDAEDEFAFPLDRHVQSNRPVVYFDKIHGALSLGWAEGGRFSSPTTGTRWPPPEGQLPVAAELLDHFRFGSLEGRDLLDEDVEP